MVITPKNTHSHITFCSLTFTCHLHVYYSLSLLSLGKNWLLNASLHAHISLRTTNPTIHLNPPSCVCVEKGGGGKGVLNCPIPSPQSHFPPYPSLTHSSSSPPPPPPSPPTSNQSSTSRSPPFLNSNHHVPITHY